MERIPYQGKDDEAKKALDFIQYHALGNVLIAEDTPTSDTLKVNQLTYYNNEMYVLLPNGSAYKWTVTPI